mmetsp:Transcript_113875/g.286195  ORF Transcript_113875/g.286195 Transcript_113875/m.286195 type:complete len:342 (-) Transcript_113875:21-1046(-)
MLCLFPDRKARTHVLKSPRGEWRRAHPAGLPSSPCVSLAVRRLRGGCVAQEAAVGLELLEVHDKPIVQQLQHSPFQLVHLLQRQACDLSVELVAVERVVLELRRQHQAASEHPMAATRADGYCRVALEEAVDVCEAQHVALVTASHEPREARQVVAEADWRGPAAAEARRPLAAARRAAQRPPLELCGQAERHLGGGGGGGGGLLGLLRRKRLCHLLLRGGRRGRGDRGRRRHRGPLQRCPLLTASRRRRRRIAGRRGRRLRRRSRRGELHIHFDNGCGLCGCRCSCGPLGPGGAGLSPTSGRVGPAAAARASRRAGVERRLRCHRAAGCPRMRAQEGEAC